MSRARLGGEESGGVVPLLVGLLMAKDEADVVEECIEHALTFCDHIYVLDNGSEDGTVEIVQALTARYPHHLTLWGIETAPFRRDMRARMYDDVHRALGANDWFLQLDADEFLQADPRPAVVRAMEGGFDVIRTWQAQFRFTDVDLAEWQSGGDDRRLPIAWRRRYFSVDWREARLFRNQPGRRWVGTESTLPDWATRFAPFCLVNRHYQFRDPDQIQHRLDLRRAVRGPHAFAHVTALDWRDEVVSTRFLRRWEPGSRIDPRPWRYYLQRVRPSRPRPTR